jgi:hypothetical protein
MIDLQGKPMAVKISIYSECLSPFLVQAFCCVLAVKRLRLLFDVLVQFI